MTDKISITLKDGMHLEAFTPAFPEPIPLDSDASVGGQDKGHRPLTMLLVGLGGCMAMDSISILRKKRQEFDHFEVRFDVTEQAEEHPNVYTKIHMHFLASGANISKEALARSLELSYTKYCPANAMLNKVADITYSYEIKELTPA